MAGNKKIRDNAENPNLRKEIGERIGKLRTAAGISQGELANRVGVSRQTVTLWENGTRDIKTTDIVRLADALNVSCDYLLREVSSDNLSANRELGLSEKSIRILKALQQKKNDVQIAKTLEGGIYAEFYSNWGIIDAFNLLLENSEYSNFWFDLLSLSELNPAEADEIDRCEVTEKNGEIEIIKDYWVDAFYEKYLDAGEYICQNQGTILSAKEYMEYKKEKLLKSIMFFIEAALLRNKTTSPPLLAWYDSALSSCEESITVSHILDIYEGKNYADNNETE